MLQLCLGAVARLCSGLCQLALQLLNLTLPAHESQVHVKQQVIYTLALTPGWAGQAGQDVNIL